ncbi:tetratricopeptide repeat protein [Tundrisphaera lichenicola]|uniref:tetratricopeptide repeat protein n=1 Tax=Tundrisphaera lichenicola TaxID=2029860 RepID=UPI003EBFC75E
MTVRWKPLLILSGLFVVVGLVGLMTIATVMGARGTEHFLDRARAERKAGAFDEAKIDYQQVLKADGRNAKLHEEMADFYEEWIRKAPVEKKSELRALYVGSLTAAAKAGTKLVGPRRRMLAEAIRQDDVDEQVRWARDLITLDPNNRDAHFILASHEFDQTAPNVAELRRHVSALEAETPRRVRTEWIAVRMAALANDSPAVDKIFDRVRSMTLPADADSLDRMALLKLRVLDVAETKDASELAGPIEAVTKEALAASSEPEIPSTRIARISLLIEEVQRSMAERALEAPAASDRLKEYGNTLEQAAEAIFQKSLAVKPYPELNVFLAYADHLRFRDQRDRCLAVANQGLKSPAGLKQAASETAMGLHALAVEASLANFADKDRQANAAPHVKALLDCKPARYQALGHLFQGAIELEKAGLVIDAQVGDIPRAEQAKLRASALGHLKIAATQLDHLAEAQARYGVALILNQEPTMGRQYLQLAQRLGNLEPQYQIWTAWAVVQAGYPEDAEPIVARMLQEIEQGRLPRDLEGTLHLLSGEIHQARKTPSDLKKAVEEYTRAFANGQDATPAVELRLAQIEVMLGRPADALKRIDWLVSKGKAGPAAENLAVLTLGELKRDDEARKRLEQARAKFPESSELAVLDASLRVKEKKPQEADQILSAYLAKVPDNVAAVQLRAQILAQELGRPDDARKVLGDVADRGDNSAPLVQLALLDLEAKNFEAVAASIAKIRTRWKNAATGDLLDAQMALAKNDLTTASGFFDAALKKDPSNKVVQFWKAQLDGRADPEGAARIFESLAVGDSVKEVDTGISLATASQSALAGLAMENGELDSAIARYRQMLKDGSASGISRAIRWQIVAAESAKKEWPTARTEIESLLNDPKSPPSDEERVRAATYYRINNEDDKALTLCDEILKTQPAYPGAVVTRAEILARTGKYDEASATIRKAVEVATKGEEKAPPVFYLMMAAVESITPPTDKGQGAERALKVLDQGLEQLPDSAELIQAKCRMLTKLQGPKAAASFVEEKAKANPKGPYRRMLLTVYGDQGDYASAERTASELLRDDPTDASSANSQIRMIAAQSIEASRQGNQAEAKRLDDKAGSLIAEYRTKFATDPIFPQLECELEIRRGDTSRALTLTQEVDEMAKGSPVGPLLRAQIFAIRSQFREAADSYAEALTRNPRLPDARLQLARLSLRNGRIDEAIRQAKFLTDAEPESPNGMAALLVEARALAAQTGASSQVQANRAQAIERLAAAIKARPDFSDAYYLTADIHMMSDQRAKAVASLKEALKVDPNDANALTSAIQILAEPRAKGQPAPKADLDEARALASSSTQDDPSGERTLAVSNGYSRANLPDEALPWAEKAAEKLGSVEARLNLGDLLLTMSEAQQLDPARSRELLNRSLAEYDKILADQPDVVAAVNNKAWILSSYQQKSEDALELAQGLLQRVDPSSLPGEFYDTLGSIQEKLNRPRDAEESYKKGLGKSPEHPVLNYHMGRLMAADKSRASKAADYLKNAQAAGDRLPAAMATELASLLKEIVH